MIPGCWRSTAHDLMILKDYKYLLVVHILGNITT
jgi:hypothetical protein